MKTTLKSFVAKGMMVALVAGALAVAGGRKAEAQVNIGVQFGQPPVYAYGAPAYGYYGPDYYARLRWERERREAWLRHEQWERARRYYAWREHDWYRR
ncbi:hypothetical protein [Edaphobacter flagellatus]|uniref:hypothetical protein n=1 Tax=Edaphobacter flagellatus TaxID=1933044 RepID=UPI0021B24FEF|nr:hypothetical protein [Edaphobacter flagellatus]